MQLGAELTMGELVDAMRSDRRFRIHAACRTAPFEAAKGGVEPNPSRCSSSALSELSIPQTLSALRGATNQVINCVMWDAEPRGIQAVGHAIAWPILGGLHHHYVRI